MQIFAFVSPPTTISLQPLATVLILMPILAFVSPRTSTSLQPLGTVSFLLGLRRSRLPKITFVVSKTTCMALVASVLRAFVVNAPLSLQQILVLLHVSGNTATKLVLIRRHYQNMSRVIKIVCLEEFTHWNAIAKITIAVNRKNMVPFWLLADPLKFHLFLTGPCFPSLPPLRCGALKETRFPTSFPLSLLCLSPALPPPLTGTFGDLLRLRRPGALLALCIRRFARANLPKANRAPNRGSKNFPARSSGLLLF